MAAPVIIRVGCAIDTSVEKTFGDIERRAVRAGKRVEQAMRPGRRRILDDGFVQQAVAQEKRHTSAVEGEAKKRERAFRAEARARRAALRDEERALRDSIREHEKAERAKAKAAAAAVREQARASRELDRFATRTSHRATRFVWPNAPLASMARRAGHDILRGIGIDTTLSGAVGRSTQLQASATALSTAGYLPGTAGPNGQRIAAGTLGAEARAVGTQYALDPAAVIEAQDQFVKLTGDLDMSRKMMGSLAGLSIASGASLQDMAAAAGEVSNAFGDMGSPEEKMKAIDQALRGLAAQGKIGAVEMRDYAKYMAHLGGTVGAFGGDRATRMMQFGAMAQLAKAYGGGTSAAVSARAVSGFRNILETPARRSKFKEYGVAIEDNQGLLRDPFAIIRDALAKTQGETEPMKEMFQNVIGARAVTGIANIYKRAGRGDKGMAAVDAELARMMKADSMTKEAVAEAVKQYEETTAAKAQRFQNNLDKIAETAAGKLIPALEKLAPTALRLAEAFAKFTTWAADNPGKAVGLALAAVITRAHLESVFRTGIERGINAAFGIAPGGKTIKGGGGFVGPGGYGGAALAGLQITALGVTMYATGVSLIDMGLNKMAAEDSKSVLDDVKRSAEVDAIKRRITERGGEVTPEEAKKLADYEASRKARLAGSAGIADDVTAGDKIATGAASAKRMIMGWLGMEGGSTVAEERKKYHDAARDNTQQLRDELRGVADVLQAIRSGGIPITNIEEARSPKTPSATGDGREPPGS
jgi:hypothetical protein